MKRLLIVLALLGACATLPGNTASAGHRHRCRTGYATPYYYRGYYSSAYRWGAVAPYYSAYGANWGSPYGYGYPGFGATWGFGFGGF